MNKYKLHWYVLSVLIFGPPWLLCWIVGVPCQLLAWGLQWVSNKCEAGAVRLWNGPE